MKLQHNDLVLKGNEDSFWSCKTNRYTWLGGDVNWQDHGGRFISHTGLGNFHLIRIEPANSWDENYHANILEESIWLDDELIMEGLELVENLDIDSYFNTLSFMEQVKIIVYELLVDKNYVTESYKYTTKKEFIQGLKDYGIYHKKA